jgi:hypothetical protein
MDTASLAKLDIINDIVFLLLDKGIVACGAKPQLLKIVALLTMKLYYFVCKLAVLCEFLTSEG